MTYLARVFRVLSYASTQFLRSRFSCTVMRWLQRSGDLDRIVARSCMAGTAHCTLGLSKTGFSAVWFEGECKRSSRDPHSVSLLLFKTISHDDAITNVLFCVQLPPSLSLLLSTVIACAFQPKFDSNNQRSFMVAEGVSTTPCILPIIRVPRKPWQQIRSQDKHRSVLTRAQRYRIRQQARLGSCSSMSRLGMT